MAIQLKGYILGTFVLCCINSVLLAVSLGTNYWVKSTANYADGGSSCQTLSVNFGMFQGSQSLQAGTVASFTNDIYLVCSTSDNACMYSCNSDSSGRQSELNNFLTTNGNLTACETGCTNVQSSTSTSGSSQTCDAITDIPSDEYVNFGVLIMTIVFVCFGIIFAIVGAVYSMINTVTSPIETINSVGGLYVWNGIGAGCDTLAAILWGSMYHSNLEQSIPVCNVLNGNYVSQGNSSLGYSYWLLLPPIFLHLINIGLVYYRSYAIAKTERRAVKVLEEDNTNGTNMLF